MVWEKAHPFIKIPKSNKSAVLWVERLYLLLIGITIIISVMIIGAMSVSIAVTPWAIDITGTKTHCNKRKSDYYLVLFKPLFHLFVFYWFVFHKKSELCKGL